MPKMPNLTSTTYNALHNAHIHVLGGVCRATTSARTTNPGFALAVGEKNAN